MGPMEKAQLLRTLPAIDKILKSAAACGLKERWLGRLVDDEIRRVVADLRQRIQEGRRPPTKAEVSDAEVIAERAGARLESRLAPGVVHCINASGVVLHTGLGRAVLPSQAIEAIRREASAYTVVSVNVEDAQRKRRETSVARILCALTGAEAATLVNNNAAATLIGLNTLAAGREAIISRGQLVEIGGSFRMPDVFKVAGVTLREVGTTNRTHLKDYACALCPETALILRVHPSNYQVTGFSKSVPLEQLVALGREHGIPVMDDLGAGALVALPPEPEISEISDSVRERFSWLFTRYDVGKALLVPLLREKISGAHRPRAGRRAPDSIPRTTDKGVWTASVPEYSRLREDCTREGKPL